MRVISILVSLGAVTAISACGESTNPLIVEGRTGGPSPNEQCTWSLHSNSQIRGAVSLSSESPDGGRQGLNVIPAGSDDVLWIEVLTFCVDAPTFVVGGVSADVASLVLTSQHSEQVVLEAYDVPGASSGAVIGELPRRWRSDNSIRVEAISKRDGDVLVEETYDL